MTAKRGRVHVRVKKFLEGERVEEGAVARLILKRNDTEPVPRNEARLSAVVPVGESAFPLELDLTAGLWSIYVSMPSGESIQEDFEVVADQSEPLDLYAASSPHEYLSWAHFAGAVPDWATLPAESPEIQKSQGTIAPQRTRDDAVRTILSNVSTSDLESIEVSEFIETAGDAVWRNLAEGGGDVESLQPQQVIRRDQLPPHDIYEVLAVDNFDTHPWQRRWAHVQAFGERCLLSIPAPWPETRGSGAWPRMEIVVQLIEEDRGLAQLVVRDEVASAMLGYLTNRRLAEASVIADRAQQWLYYKVSNTLAAAAGGYVMLATRLAGEDTEWRGWIRNLSNNFEFLPDGAILEGAMCLNGPEDVRDFDRAAVCFLTALDRGLPYYTLGLAWLRSGLDTLKFDYIDLSEPAELVSRVARQAETNTPFTTLRLPPAPE